MEKGLQARVGSTPVGYDFGSTRILDTLSGATVGSISSVSHSTMR